MSLKPKRVDFDATWSKLKDTVRGVITFSNVPRAVWNDRFTGSPGALPGSGTCLRHPSVSFRRVLALRGLSGAAGGPIVRGDKNLSRGARRHAAGQGPRRVRPQLAVRLPPSLERVFQGYRLLAHVVLVRLLIRPSHQVTESTVTQAIERYLGQGQNLKICSKSDVVPVIALQHGLCIERPILTHFTT